MSIPVRNIVRMATASVSSRVLDRRRPLNVMLAVTDRCTGRCAYCAIPQRRSPEMSLEQIRRLLDEVADLGCQRVGIWGGEPLCRDDLGAIVRHAKRHRLFVTVDTNGHLIDERFEALAEVDHLNVSLDGGREAHDASRGAGNFDRTLRGILRAAPHKPTWTITVLNRHNLDQVGQVLDMARRIGFLCSFQVLHHNDQLGRNDDLRPEDDQVREVFRQLVARKKEGAPVASSMQYLEHMLAWPDMTRSRLPTFADYPDCFAGRLYCNVDVDGSLYPCSLYIDEIEAPNVLEAGFADAFERLETPRCRACTAACFTEYNHLYRLDWRTGLNWVRALRR